MSLEIDHYVYRVARAYALFHGNGENDERVAQKAKDILGGMGVVELLEKLNPKFPADTLKPELALLAICNMSFRLPRLSDVTLVKDRLPSAYKEIRVHILLNEIEIVGNLGKRSSAYWRLNYRNSELPFELEAVQYADMDNLENHSEECPSRLETDDPEYSDDCHCEAGISKRDRLTIATSEGATEKLEDFLRWFFPY